MLVQLSQNKLASITCGNCKNSSDKSFKFSLDVVGCRDCVEVVAQRWCVIATKIRFAVTRSDRLDLNRYKILYIKSLKYRIE